MSGWTLWLLALVGTAMAFAALVRQWAQAFQGAVRTGAGEGEAVPMGVLVPVRDEAGGITALLQDLAMQVPRPPEEVIVVDDGSTDGTAERVEAMAVRWPALRLLRSGGQGKKAALEAGVAAAAHPVVLFTDGDVRCGPGRSAAMGRAWRTASPDLLLAPVFLREATGLLGRYQREEQAMLLGIAMGSAAAGRPLLANGANLAVRRTAFTALGGYAADRRWASGDDMFLLQRVRRAGGRVAVTADPAAAVEVRPAPDLGAWWRQRLRWAGKLRAYRDPAAMAFGALSVGLPWALAFTTAKACGVRTGEGLLGSWALLALAWAAWLGPALGLVRAAKEVQGLRHGPLGSAVAMLWTAFTAPLIAAAALVLRPRWKGRRV